MRMRGAKIFCCVDLQRSKTVYKRTKPLPPVLSLLSLVILWSNPATDSTLSGRLRLATSVETLIRFWFGCASATRSSTSWTRWFIISTRTKAAVQINKDTSDTGQTSLGEQLWKSRADECSCFSAMIKHWRPTIMQHSLWCGVKIYSPRSVYMKFDSRVYSGLN